MYLCRFAGAEYRRSVGLLTNIQALSSDVYLGWPSFNTLESVLQYVGPLPASTTHPSLRGLAEKGGFKYFKVQSLGPQFSAASSPTCKIRSFTTPLGMEVLLFHAAQLVFILLVTNLDMGSPFGCPDSVAALHEEWKAKALTRTILRDYSASRLDTFFESREMAPDTVFLFSLLSPASARIRFSCCS